MLGQILWIKCSSTYFMNHCYYLLWIITHLSYLYVCFQVKRKREHRVQGLCAARLPHHQKGLCQRRSLRQTEAKWTSMNNIQQKNGILWNGRQLYTQAPVDGWNCNPPPPPEVIQAVPFSRGGAVRTCITEGVTVPSSDWRSLYICFISVID